MRLEMTCRRIVHSALLAACVLGLARRVSAEEHILFTNGFEMSCLRHEVRPEAGTVRIYCSTSSSGDAAYLEVAAASIRMIAAADGPPAENAARTTPAPSGKESLQGLLHEAGARHHIDVDLLAALVLAESGGHAKAISRTGARGLMQLMPATAASLGVHDAFVPEQNIAGGTAYLDQLLTRFHDDLALALAAYNAGPGAVDRWHGVPPFRETHAYVARIIREYNRRKATVAGVMVP